MIIFGYLETQLNATGEYWPMHTKGHAYMHTHAYKYERYCFNPSLLSIVA